ncbi:MAG: molybdopterin biosynthesis protein MoeB [Alphaproteobacteria bacterium]|nr:molybdopterin biosynthesis protein MoeB [Hyphomonas sp.]MBR9807918.1 molybdopterin biosynthesis protein MoeB [Alphaproteobacteria bacterium]|tara:strand:- start:7397 stop:8152 length:756 start_codon:yes stop_codon:yes gene_type:complete
MSPLSPEDLARHKRHIMLKEIGGPGVQKLRAAAVSIVGAGALGGPCAMFLAAAGVGKLEIWDDDHVERSNLQRQVQFGEGDLGKYKADVLAAHLMRDHPSTVVEPRRKRWADSDALHGKILVDATDNFATRYALNQVAHASARYMVHGAAAGWRGQVSVFASGRTGDAPCYQCWVPETPPDAEACDEVGVVGPVTGMVSTAMALEVIKLVTGAGSPLIGRILLLDGLSATPRTIGLRRDAACPVCNQLPAI